MIIWYLLILIAALVGIRVCKNGFFPDFLGKEQSNAIKGVFILLVFLAHALTYLRNCGFDSVHGLDRAAYSVWSEMGQLVVAVFFFYSGYGVMTSLRMKGEKYLETYPKSRLLTTLLNFDIAVCCYWIMNWALGGHLSLSQALFSLIGWESAGNSNWYIFDILVCYSVFYLVFKIIRKNDLVGVFMVVCLVLASMLALHKLKGDAYWYNTILVFPAGVFYALYAKEINEGIQKHYWLVLAFLTGAFLVLHLGPIKSFHGLTYNLKAIVFSVLVVVLTMKVRIGNKWLAWCGLSLFPIYIYQRLPMIAIRGLAGEEWVCGNPHGFIAVCFLVTVGISLLYNRCLRIKLV